MGAEFQSDIEMIKELKLLPIMTAAKIPISKPKKTRTSERTIDEVI